MKKIILIVAAFIITPYTNSYAQGYSGGFNAYGSNKTMQYQSRMDQQQQEAQPTETEEKSKGGKIRVNYSNFSIAKTPSGKITCGITFNLVNDTSSQLRSLSLGLAWSAMKTSISYDNLPPKESKKLEYRLIGECCYTISGAPEIVVNSCRLKDYTDDECADSIEWK